MYVNYKGFGKSCGGYNLDQLTVILNLLRQGHRHARWGHQGWGQWGHQGCQKTRERQHVRQLRKQPASCVLATYWSTLNWRHCVGQGPKTTSDPPSFRDVSFGGNADDQYIPLSKWLPRSRLYLVHRRLIEVVLTQKDQSNWPIAIFFQLRSPRNGSVKRSLAFCKHSVASMSKYNIKPSNKRGCSGQLSRTHPASLIFSSMASGRWGYVKYGIQ